MRREGEEGTVLVTVLAMIALSSAVLVTMISTQETGIARSQRYSEASQALEIARGGEASAIAVLRRDARDAAEIDHAGEAWAALAETERRIEGGMFSLVIEDAQGRFNLRAGGRTGVLFDGTVRRIVKRAMPGADLDAILGDDPAAMLALAQAVDPALVERIAPYTTWLPQATDVNVNAADEALLAILLQNPVSARRIAGIRRRQGYVGEADLKRLGILLPNGLGLTSDFFTVTTVVTVGGTTQRMESLLYRRRKGEEIIVDVVSRRRGAVIGNDFAKKARPRSEGALRGL